MPNTAQGYCDEFCLSIDPTRYITGNWFGRLLAYQWRVVNFFGNDYSEEQFRTKIEDGSIKIISISAPFNIAANFGNDVTVPGTITGNFDIEAEVDGTRYSQTLSFEHEVKWSIQATETTLT